jgi:cob(I)alamin adenosyltransferase
MAWFVPCEIVCSLQPEHLSSDVRCGWSAGHGAGADVQEYATVTARDVTRLEKLMDRCQKDLPPLKEFILPGGGKISSLLHQARTICRWAERLCVRLGREERLDPVLVHFLNRLSDALFVLARWMAKQQNEPECLWERDPNGA